jgi:hypothetical protein
MPGSSMGQGRQRGTHYLMGMGCILLLFLGLLAVAPVEWRPSLALAAGLSMTIQIPLGLWLLSSLGSDRFLPVWVLGMLVRLTLVGVAGLALWPALGWPMTPGLIGLVLLLMASLAVEGLVLLLEFRGAGAR